MAISRSFVKGQAFNLESLSNLSIDEPKFTRKGYTFNNWTDGSNTYTDQQEVTFNVDTVNLTATWTINQYAINFQSQYKDGDQIIGNVNVKVGDEQKNPHDMVDFGSTLSIAATPAYIGKLTSFKINGVEQITEPTTEPVTKTYTITEEQDVDIVMVFSDNQGTITYNPGY